MCGRFWLKKKGVALESLVGPEEPLELHESYNIATGQWASIITGPVRPQVRLFKWGLIPAWAKNPDLGYQMINARAETIAEKASYRTLPASHRCLVPCSGFYEWQQKGKQKQPFNIQRKDQQLFTLAGFWTGRKSPLLQEIQSFTIITTAANSLLAPIHDRMPVIIPEQRRPAWLFDRDVKTALGFLEPYSREDMEKYQISPYANSPEHNDEQCPAPLGT